MSNYFEIPIDRIEIDSENPRIAHHLLNRTPESIDADFLALVLGTSAQVTESLRESIRQYKGLIHPIIIKKIGVNLYRVIEGNTRLQIYKDFLKDGIPGDWSKIKCIIHEGISNEDVHAIRLQAHLVGPREWDSYSKAKYLCHLSDVERMPMNQLISLCGGSSKASEIKNMIAAYKDMEKYYRPLCGDDTQFDIKKFQGFVQLQNKRVIDSLIGHGLCKKAFSTWIRDDKFSRLEHIRNLPEILNSSKARKKFLTENSAEAKKILAVEEITPNALKDIPYEQLAKELSKRIVGIPHLEVIKLRDDAEFGDKLKSLRDVCDNIKDIVLKEIDGE